MTSTRLYRLRNAVRGVTRRRARAELAAGSTTAGTSTPPAAAESAPAASVAISVWTEPGAPLHPSLAAPARPATAVAGRVVVPEVVVPEVVVPRVAGSPFVALVVTLTAISVLIHHNQLGLTVSGGGLLPTPGGPAGLLGHYVDEWHPVFGGTAAPASALTGLLGLLGLVVGGADHAVALLLIAALPLAGTSAYLAARAVQLPALWRAGVAAAWALLPVGAVGVSQGRLDTVLTHVLLPVVLAGVVSILRGAPSGEAGRVGSTWLATAASTSLGLAVVGAAAPVVHGLLVLVALVGFVVVGPRPGSGTGVRRSIALFALVLLPLVLLGPWLAVVLAHPSELLLGFGTPLPGASVGVLGLAGLGGTASGVPGALGGLVVLGAVVLGVAVHDRRMLGGLAVALLGAGAATVIASRRTAGLNGGPDVPGSTGPALVLAAAGVFLVVVVGLARLPGGSGAGLRTVLPRSAYAGAVLVVGVGVLFALAVGTALSAVNGPVRAKTTAQLPVELRVALEKAGSSVLTMGAPGELDRLGPPTLPQLGDDDLAPVAGSVRRTALWAAAINGNDTTTAVTALGEAAAAGVGAVVFPSGAVPARRLLESGLVTAAGRTTDGRAVLRVELTSGGAQLLEPTRAVSARTGGAAPTAVDVPGITAVSGGPPTLGVRVSAGAAGRLLVLSAEDEPGWRVSVDGRAVAVARAYGHLVGVALPESASEAVVTRSSVLRSVLLLGQAAALLFTAFVAVPVRRRLS